MKYAKYIIPTAVFVFLAVWWVGKTIDSNTPPFVLNKLDSLRANKTLMDSIGGFRQFEYSYNKEDFKRGDTVRYSIKIHGASADAVYDGTHVKGLTGNWELYTDTLTIQ